MLAPVTPVGPCPSKPVIGSCDKQCEPGTKSKCTGGQICCFNGCGYECTNPGTLMISIIDDVDISKNLIASLSLANEQLFQRSGDE